MAETLVPRAVTLSERFYRLLLLAYPAEFRRTYAREMVQTFRDCCREALREQGGRGITRLWGLILYDLTTTACIEHGKAFMTRLKRILGKDSLLITSEGMEQIVMAKAMQLTVAQRTDIGLKRSVNEDNLLSIVPEDPQVLTDKGALFIVADGLGGHGNGEVASEMAVNTVRETYYQDENEDIGTSLQHTFRRANELIHSMNMTKEPQSAEEHIMGTTCIAAVLQGNTLYVANVGDSRAYIVHEGQLRQISLDHSWVAQQVRDGLLTPEQAIGHEKSNVIYRCLGTSAEVEIDVFSEQVQEGDILVLCTDGLWDMLPDADILSIVEQYDPQESVQQLIARANEKGGRDNIAAIVVRVAPE